MAEIQISTPIAKAVITEDGRIVHVGEGTGVALQTEAEIRADERRVVLAELLSDEAIEAAARAAWEPEHIVGWDHATQTAQDDARKRIRLAFEAAFASLAEETK